MNEVAFTHAPTEQKHLSFRHFPRNNNRGTVNTTTMENSPIATLSAELRNQIYHLVLTHPEPIVITSSMSGGKIWSRVARRRKLLALTRTCRTIREESVKIFYAVNTFKHLVGDYGPRPSDLVLNFDDQIGRELAAVICKVVLMPQVIRLTTSSSDDLGGDSKVIYTAKELAYLASEDDSRTYQLQCNFHCYTELQNGPPWQRWEEKLLRSKKQKILLLESMLKLNAGNMAASGTVKSTMTASSMEDGKGMCNDEDRGSLHVCTDECER
ncbi:hypothetical protein KC326_g8 [Hortaea werneckii]|nr:hypothetical protein KC326_g8 [Hortaea werneckii]